ncbi:MAG: DUF5009 domain-containing protein, partial [Cyclobacteriaceae bacterium]|nr:DUF5009 domain-containing protein [Cyclobacteriaceae bacterium]
MQTDTIKTERLMSIDALRGFDMLTIIFLDKFFYSYNRAADTQFSNFMATQFDHPEWYGFHFYDIIMPLFLFLVGMSIPFSITKRLSINSDLPSLYRHLIKRFIILWILGMICQGNMLDFDLGTLHLYSNTLQAIAVGYILSSLAFLHLSQKGRYMLFAGLLVTYAILLAVPNVPGVGTSVILPDKNFPLYIDRLLLGHFDDGTQYSWIITGLGFTATVLSGIFASELIRSSLPKQKIALYLVLIGIAGIALGLIWGIWHPIVKKLWTSSFVLFLSGMCYILMAAFYWVIDVKGYQRWAFWLRVIGMNAIFAYVITHVMRFSNIAKPILYGTEQIFGEYYPAVLEVGGFGILYFILWY